MIKKTRIPSNQNWTFSKHPRKTKRNVLVLPTRRDCEYVSWPRTSQNSFPNSLTNASIKRSKLYAMKLITDKRQTMKFNIFSQTNAISWVQAITSPHTEKPKNFYLVLIFFTNQTENNNQTQLQKGTHHEQSTLFTVSGAIKQKDINKPPRKGKTVRKFVQLIDCL